MWGRAKAGEPYCKIDWVQLVGSAEQIFEARRRGPQPGSGF